MLNVKQVFKQLFGQVEQKNLKNNYKSYFYNFGDPIWSNRDYLKFADEAYRKNVIAYRCINIIAEAAASVPWIVYKCEKDNLYKQKHHPLIELLKKPNPLYAGSEFFQNIYAYKLISGNSYILVITPKSGIPTELHILRPDRVSVITGKGNIVTGYVYEVENEKKIYPINRITGKSDILHIRNFHPLDDLYGLSPIESAAYSIDQHNQAAIWNQSLLQNGARPSGALIVKNDNNSHLDDHQFSRLKEQFMEAHTGANKAGTPLLLEGGIEWCEMSLTPKDMDFIEAKNSAARDIALAFGVPPQLLGIPGDNTYSNLQEARLALWEETILPMLDHMCDALNNWLVPKFKENLKIAYDRDAISVLSKRRDDIWQRLENTSFLTTNEKRAVIGLSPIND